MWSNICNISFYDSFIILIIMVISVFYYIDHNCNFYLWKSKITGMNWNFLLCCLFSSGKVIKCTFDNNFLSWQLAWLAKPTRFFIYPCHLNWDVFWKLSVFSMQYSIWSKNWCEKVQACIGWHYNILLYHLTYRIL